ncbi:hypothetical protein AVEN_41145-1 [Araneus ventricosus]|uniref:Uncharacterized protein n=1 Tax=Araneus ventricosus TaxID=182803 RepID=A0A4Y2JX19_ARAVE|nr:hypothetical protein AVEN_41145-1 [Araneus ventricosus]
MKLLGSLILDSSQLLPRNFEMRPFTIAGAEAELIRGRHANRLLIRIFSPPTGAINHRGKLLNDFWRRPSPPHATESLSVYLSSSSHTRRHAK